MKNTILLLLCFCVSCSTSSQKKKTTKLAVPLPGGGYHIMESHIVEPVFKPAAARIAIFPWQYDLPQGTVPSNYWWNLEHSFNNKQWSVIRSNVSIPLIVETTNTLEFFRLQGRP